MARWTKATYEMVAYVLDSASEQGALDGAGLACLIDLLSDRFSSDNSAFDKQRFTQAAQAHKDREERWE